MVKEEINLMPEGYTINSESRLKAFKALLDGLYETKPYVRVEYYTHKPRTPQQNSALHAYLGDIADKCNDAGYWLKITSPVLSGEVEIQWTKQNVKERMWRPVQNALYPETKSSKNLSTVELSAVADRLSGYLWDSHKIRATMGKQQ